MPKKGSVETYKDTHHAAVMLMNGLCRAGTHRRFLTWAFT
jgi:hypothetical protein